MSNTENKKPAARPLCPVRNKCGGCTYQGKTYSNELSLKQHYMETTLKSCGPVKTIIGMKNPDNYRNKVHAVFGFEGRSHTIVAGTYQAGTHRIVSVTSCQLDNEKADAIIQTIKNLLRSFKIKTYDEDTCYGLLRHVLVRTGKNSGEIMVILVTASPILPSKNNFVKALRKEHPEITTVVLNINDKQTSMILGSRNITLYGKGYIVDSLCGCTFRISPSAFYQVNPVQTEVLYNTALEYAGLTGKETVIDAYCGIGTIGICASAKAGKVIGVEINREAVNDARQNARHNDCKNIEFISADAGEFMTSYAENGGHADVVMMDPPRAGSTEAFLAAICKLAPKRIVYVSCNPETLQRDLTWLQKNNYTAKQIQPVDMFPHTVHIESVVLLTKTK